ncbi:MAG TPA: ABC transporter permease [Marmoricola sp.]|jgi:ABC-type transport system involved in multi-copper enzyme maturation permease subunit|nr:ABC transporter permease [Marmoricola sp.]
MRAALAYELVRIRTIRSTWWLTGIAVVVGVGISTLFSWGLATSFADSGPSGPPEVGAAVVTQLAATGQVPNIVCFVLAIIGVLAWGHEYRHGMIRASLTALTSRTALWAAKFLVVGVWVAVVAFVTFVIAGLVGTAFLSEWVDVFAGATWSVLAREVLYAVLLAWLAMAFTALTRSQAFALVTLFLWPLLVENIVQLMFLLVPQLRDDRDVLRFLPFDAGARMVDVLSHATSTFGSPLSALGGALVFGGTTLVLMVASLLAFRTRDA